MGKLDRRHYVPAALIGHFSKDPHPVSLRKSTVAVHRFNPPADFQSAAGNIGFSRSLYRGVVPFIGDEPPPLDHDDYFSALEFHALRPVDQLRECLSGNLPADAWVKVAAFVASQFARDPSQKAELDDRAEQAGVARDQLDMGYSLNTQRIASAVLRARWEFLRTPKDLVLNDRAISTVQFGDWGLRGYFIPLRKDFGVRIAGGPHPKQVTWSDSDWRIAVPVKELSDEQTDNLNRWTWCGAATELYGSSSELLAEIERQAASMREDIPNLSQYVSGAGLLGASDQERHDDETLLIRLLGGIRPPNDANDAPALIV